VLQPSPLKEISSRDYEGREVLRKNKERSLNYFVGLSGTKVGIITFLTLGLGTCLLSVRTCRRKPLQSEVNMNTHCFVKRMKDSCTESHVKTQGQGSMVTKTQGVCLVGVTDTPVILSHNERTSDEYGNACVQEGLTSQ
jgi:hypothetical protein